MTASSMTLADAEARVRASMGSVIVEVPGQSVYDEGIRKALEEMSLAAGENLTLEDLDGATATTIRVEDEVTLINGGCYWAGFMLTINRLETPVTGIEMPTQTLEWVDKFMKMFYQGVNYIRLRALRESANPPAFTVTWDESNKSW